MPQRNRGFTLYELLLSLLLLVLLATVALPSFGQMNARTRIRAEVDALFHAVHLARKESIMRRSVVSLCPRSGASGCEPGTDWSRGWIMFNNRDRDEPPQIDPGEAILQVHRAGPNVRIAANRRSFTLRATEKRATNGTIVICDSADRVTPRALVVSYTGRPRVTIKNSRGDAYSCAD